jgi:hypothetical protein
MPVDTNQAAYVRHTGQPAGIYLFSRALLPVASNDGNINLSLLRDPSHPFDPEGHPNSRSSQPVRLWFDLHIPADAIADDYRTNCNLLLPDQPQPVSTVPVSVHVYNFALPDARSLACVSQLDWNSLRRFYPDRFESITPRLMNRGNPLYSDPLKTIDDLMRLAQQNRLQLTLSRLQPTVKWPAGQPPQVDWTDFDSVVAPWLSGDAFADQVPFNFWPLPRIDYLDNFDAKSRQDYWSDAARHFNGQNWLQSSAVLVDRSTPNRLTDVQCRVMSQEARLLLDAHPLLRVALPMTDRELQFAQPDNTLAPDPSDSQRIIAAASAMVDSSASPNWPANTRPPAHWLWTDLPGGGGLNDERDVRAWAWWAFLKHADLIWWPHPFPEQSVPSNPANAGDLIWFYPGQWFGVDQPVPTIQLKWLRRAQQDYEYLHLAADRGMATEAYMLARLITRQVRVPAKELPDPAYGLLTGTVQQRNWDIAQELLARAILLRAPGLPPNDPSLKSQQMALDLDTLRWQQPNERPYLLPRSIQWLWEDPSHANGDDQLFVRLGLDIYNAGDNRPDQNLLQWRAAPDGWQFSPWPQVIGALSTYAVQKFSINAHVNLQQVQPGAPKPVEFSFVDGYTRVDYRASAILPIAATSRHEQHLLIDANLDDWDPSDLIQNGNLIRMLDRPSLQRGQISRAQSPSQVYTGWGDDDFYVAFHLNGAGTENALHRNFVDFQLRRAWGEDLCEVLVQAVYDDNTVSPVTYLACKPNGVCVVKRRVQAPDHSNSWLQTDGTLVRYASDHKGDSWTGEMAIPWRLLLDADPRHPRLLRFNFIQHRADTGESASWAGPVDSDLDDAYMGLLFLREIAQPGMR